jgi:diguanylate cyclase (GGDEF)-like protein
MAAIVGTRSLCLLLRAALLRRMAAETALRRAAERLEVMANTDPLTGLSNRRAFEEALAREWLRCIRSRHAVSLLMLDADCFKLFNDRYGHPAGDRVLQQVARCIEAGVRRPADTCARYGGEEFIVLLPETDIQGAAVVAERIRGGFASLDIPHADSPHGRATVSVGVAMAWPSPGEAAAMLVQQVDLALYQAKATGRNRVVLAQGNPVEAADGNISWGSVTVFEPGPA